MSGSVVFQTSIIDTASGAVLSDLNAPSSSFRAIIEDADDHFDATATDSVTVSISVNPAAGALSGTLTRAAVNGIVDFDNCVITGAGVGYVIRVDAPDKTGTASAPFTVTGAMSTALSGSWVNVAEIRSSRPRMELAKT